MKYLLSFFLITSIFLTQIYAQQSPTRTLTVTVLNARTEPIVNLPQSAFKVYEDKKIQTITSFDTNEKPASVGFLFDVSGSVSNNYNEAINLPRHGFSNFINASNPLNEYFIMGFNDQVKLVTDWTNKEDEINNGLNQLPLLRKDCPRSCSPVYDAYFVAIEKLIRSNHSKRVLIVVTDGDDYDSKHSQKELMQFVREKDILIYNFLIFNYRDTYEEVQQKIYLMNKLSDLTGGYTYDFPNPPGGLSSKEFNLLKIEFQKMFGNIASILKSQYEISYKPSNNDSDKKTHKIKVELNLSPELKKQSGKFQVLHRL